MTQTERRSRNSYCGRALRTTPRHRTPHHRLIVLPHRLDGGGRSRISQSCGPARCVSAPGPVPMFVDHTSHVHQSFLRDPRLGNGDASPIRKRRHQIAAGDPKTGALVEPVCPTRSRRQTFLLQNVLRPPQSRALSRPPPRPAAGRRRKIQMRHECGPLPCSPVSTPHPDRWDFQRCHEDGRQNATFRSGNTPGLRFSCSREISCESASSPST